MYNHLSEGIYTLRLPDQVTGWIKSLNPIGMGFKVCGQAGKITRLPAIFKTAAEKTAYSPMILTSTRLLRRPSNSP